jgi:thioredoxin reductase
LCSGQEVIVVGGGNSAGQGAVPNAQWLAGCVALDDQKLIKTCRVVKE